MTRGVVGPFERGRNLMRARTGRIEGTPYVRWMQKRSEYLRAEAEKCRAQARKYRSATAMFVCLDLADEMLKQAAQAELEEKQAVSDNKKPTA